MKSKWIHRLLIKQQGAYHLVNLYTYWSKLSSQWLVNSSKASCSLRLLRGVPITNGESAKYSSLVWLFSTQSTQEAFLFYEAEVSGSKVSSDGKITLGWKAKIGSCRSESILPFIDTYANAMDQIGWLQLPPAGQDMLHAVSTEKRSIEPQQSKCTEKETRCSGALNSGENAYFVSRTFCSHLLNWCSFSANKSSPVQGKCLPVKQHPDAMVIMVLVGWEDEDKAWRINGKVMTLSWGWMQLLPRLNKRFNASQCRHRLKKATTT